MYGNNKQPAQKSMGVLCLRQINKQMHKTLPATETHSDSNMGKRRKISKYEGRQQDKVPAELYLLMKMAANVDQPFSNTQGVIMPRKRFYRCRAHSNPLNDFHFNGPVHPNDREW